MKKTTFLRLFVAIVLLSSVDFVVAQEPVIKKSSSKVVEQLLSGTIKGTITVPKSIGLPANFISHLRGIAPGDNNIRDGFHAYSYKFENNQLTDKKEVNLTAIQVIDITTTNSSNYTFNYTITGRFLGGKSIDLAVVGWYIQGATAIVFEKTNANQLATFTTQDAVFEGFNFKAESQIIPK
jgi:hypothetical protein